MSDRFEQLRLIEAILFASAEPLGSAQLGRHLPEGTDLAALMQELAALYANRGVNLVQAGERWAFRTASDLAPLMQVEHKVVRKLSRAALETLAVIAYHQPVTRGEIEEVRGVALSKGTLDTLLEAGWVKPKGRRRTPGRPVTWATTPDFLDHFGLEGLDALPGLADLKAAGLLDARPAISAMGEQGGLADTEGADAAPGGAADEREEGGEPWDLLAAEFGEDLLADGPDQAAEEPVSVDAASADPAAGDDKPI